MIDPIQTYLSEAKERESKALCSKDLSKIRALHLEAAASGDWKSITIDHLLGDLEPARTDIPTLVRVVEEAMGALNHIKRMPFIDNATGLAKDTLTKIRAIVEGARK